MEYGLWLPAGGAGELVDVSRGVVRCVILTLLKVCASLPECSPGPLLDFVIVVSICGRLVSLSIMAFHAAHLQLWLGLFVVGGVLYVGSSLCPAGVVMDP